MKLISLIVIGLVCSGCVTLKSGEYCDLIPQSDIPIIKPAHYDGDFIRSQLIRITSKQGTFEFISQLEVSRGKLVLVALTPIGQKLFQIQYAGSDIQFDTFGMPVDFDPAYLVSDLGLIYAREQAITRCVADSGSALQVLEMEADRRIFVSQQKQMVIDYTARNQSGLEKIFYSNQWLDYRIEIQSLEIERR